MKIKVLVRNILTNKTSWSDPIQSDDFGHAEEILLKRFREIGKEKQWRIEKMERV